MAALSSTELNTSDPNYQAMLTTELLDTSNIVDVPADLSTPFDYLTNSDTDADNADLGSARRWEWYCKDPACPKYWSAWSCKSNFWLHLYETAVHLASLTRRALYGEEGLKEAGGIPAVRDEYLAWAMEGRRPLDYIDYYGVTFDHLVPADDPNPEVLAISIIEVDNDGGAFANKVLPFQIDPTEYTGKKVLAVPRCCQVKKGTQDRQRWNALVAERDRETQRRS